MLMLYCACAGIFTRFDLKEGTKKGANPIHKSPLFQFRDDWVVEVVMLGSST